MRFERRDHEAAEDVQTIEQAVERMRDTGRA
jgi:hypothetical protein